jgi:hypothetical protein
MALLGVTMSLITLFSDERLENKAVIELSKPLLIIDKRLSKTQELTKPTSSKNQTHFPPHS